MIRKLIERRAQGVAIFHLWAAAPFYSIFVDNGHLTRMVTWFRTVRPTFIGEGRTFHGILHFDSLIFTFNGAVRNPLQTVWDRSHCLQSGCKYCQG